MRSLPQVLHEAAQRNASEIVLESGESPMIRTAAGAVAFGEVFAEADLFDALGQVLGPEQQAELAVGNVVEFHIDSGSGRWSLVTEAGMQGIVVRGRCSTLDGEKERVGISLDLPPLEHSDDADPPPSMSDSVLNRATRRTALDLAASVPDVEAPSPAADDPSARPSWLESNEGFAGADEAPDPDPHAAMGFELRGSDPGRAIELPEDPGDPADAGGLGALIEGGSAPTDDASFAGHVRSLAAGTLCLVRRPPGSERLARQMPTTAVIVDHTTDEHLFATALERDEETTYYVCLEDPSARLGWILRRLEEGARVVVATRARSFDGAKRVLLGLSPSSRAEAWLAAHRVCWLASRNGAWALEH